MVQEQTKQDSGEGNGRACAVEFEHALNEILQFLTQRTQRGAEENRIGKLPVVLSYIRRGAQGI